MKTKKVLEKELKELRRKYFEQLQWINLVRCNVKLPPEYYTWFDGEEKEG